MGRSSIQCYINDEPGQEIYSFISIDDDALLVESNDVMKAGDVFLVSTGSYETVHLRSFSLGPVISSHPSIIPQSACAAQMKFDSTEHIWIYGLACLNTNGEYVFLESSDDANKIVVTSQKNANFCEFAFSPSSLPDIEGYDGNIDFKFLGAQSHVYGKHAPYDYILSDKYETEPGYYGYEINVLIDNVRLLVDNKLKVNDQTPLIISIHNEID